LIGAVLVGYRDLAELRRLVTPADFDQPSLGMIWQAIIRVWEEGRTPEPLAVWEALGEWRRRIGQGPVVLHDLMAEAAAPVQAPWYAEGVADAARRRRIAEAGARLWQLAMPDRPVEGLGGDGRAALDGVSLGGGRGGPAGARAGVGGAARAPATGLPACAGAAAAWWSPGGRWGWWCHRWCGRPRGPGCPSACRGPAPAPG